MYTEAYYAEVRAEEKKRRLLTGIPAALLLLSGVVVFAISQAQRQAWGWKVACILTLVGGAYFLFLLGVYVQPMGTYRKYVKMMLTGRRRETVGMLTEIAAVTMDKDGLDCYRLMVNVGETGSPEDERLFYYDSLKPSLPFAAGDRVMVVSVDKMIADIREA